jgi:hypothetical protein
LLEEALIFHRPDKHLTVFYRFPDRRVYTATILNFQGDPRKFYALAKILGHDPTIRPSRILMQAAAGIAPMRLDFEGPTTEDVRLMSDGEAIYAQFHGVAIESFRSMLQRFAQEGSLRFASAQRRLWRYFLRDALIAMRRFLAPLDHGALQVARPNSPQGAEAYHFYAIAEPIIQRYRQQAAQSFPILAGMLPRWHGAADDVFRSLNSEPRRWHLLRLKIGTVDYPSWLDAVRATNPDAARLGKIAEAIDQARSLNTALADTLGLSPATIKALRVGRFGYPSMGRFPEFCGFLESIPANLRPRQSEDFLLLDRGIEKMKDMLSPTALPKEFMVAFTRQHQDIIRQWLQPVARDAHRRGWGAAFAAIDMAVDDLQDFLKAMAAWIADRDHHNRYDDVPDWFYPGYPWQGNRPQLNNRMTSAYCEILALFRQESARRVAKLSADWHGAIPHARRQMRAALRPAISNGRRQTSIFPLILRRPRAIGGFQFVPLLSPRALDAEGAAMNHCVGSYIDPARRGQSILFSVLGEYGHRISTFEVSPSIVRENTQKKVAARLSFTLVQHKGPRNTQPPQDAQQAVFSFLQAANAFEFDFTARGSLTRYHRVKQRLPPRSRSGINVEAEITRRANALVFERLFPNIDGA